MSERRFDGVWIPASVWLRKDLSATEKCLLVEIHSLDSSSKHCFASNSYLSDFLGCSVDTVTRAIKKLTDISLIKVKFKKTKTGTERVIQSKLDKANPTPQNQETPTPQNAEHSIPLLLGDLNNKDTSETKKKVERQKHGEYQHVLLSTSEVERLRQKFPLDWQQRIEALDRGIELHGYKYKNFYLAILEWDRRDKQKAAPPKTNDAHRFHDPRAERLKREAHVS